MIAFTKWFYLVFGLLSAFGGYMGFKKAGSKASLIAGFACGLLLVVASLLPPAQPNVSFIIGLVVSVALLGQFLPKLLQGELKPHILLTSFFSAGNLVITIISWYK